MKVIEAIKKIYPIIQGGFVYWQTSQDGTPLTNPIDGLVWENTEFTKPTWEQIEAQLHIVELEEAKTTKLAQIAPARDAFMYADIEYNGSFFTNTLTSGNNITAALAIMGTSINWLDASGNQVVMTKAQLKELGSLILTKRSISYLQEAVLIGQINACQSLEEVEAINITFE